MQIHKVTEGKVMLCTHFDLDRDLESDFFLFSLVSLQKKGKERNEDSWLIEILKECAHKQPFPFIHKFPGCESLR